MAGVTGLEPATSGVTGRRSNQLSYTPTQQVEGLIRPSAESVKRSKSQKAAALDKFFKHKLSKANFDWDRQNKNPGKSQGSRKLFNKEARNGGR